MALLKKLLTKYSRFIKFGVVGASGVVVNWGVHFVLSRLLAFGIFLSYAIAIEISIITNFLLNDVWTFRDRRGGAAGSFWMRGLKFNLVSLGGLVINWGVFRLIIYILTDVKGLDEAAIKAGYYDFVASAIGIGASLFWNYLANLFWTWRTSSRGGDASKH